MGKDDVGCVGWLIALIVVVPFLWLSSEFGWAGILLPLFLVLIGHGLYRLSRYQKAEESARAALAGPRTRMTREPVFSREVPELPGEPMTVDGHSEAGVTCTVDPAALTCSCPDGQERAKNFSGRDPRRCCKHLREVITMVLPPETDPIIRVIMAQPKAPDVWHEETLEIVGSSPFSSSIAVSGNVVCSARSAMS
ncbi:MAG TPA: hypothetical protein PLQ97_02800 [Myxococcota bacterium]|nr:hypothetical protein [Myxococcota bacterium]HQK50759.1 hypothetical protein [Myxococcota bacterium]